ncbi:MAG: hypothetical protein Q9195_003501 [Heterodermia aff. obscurata]
MSSKSFLTYAKRAESHPNPAAAKLLKIAETKKTNIVLSADLMTTKDLLHLADSLGPYIAVFKTHIDIVSDFGDETVYGLKTLAEKHNFMIFEDRKFVDIGTVVQKQYHRGAFRISEWAHIVNACGLAGDGIVEALTKTGTSDTFEYKGDRALLMLAEMTTKGSLATGPYTTACIESAKKHKDFVIGFVANQALTTVDSSLASEDEDFVIFTTGVNRAMKGDPLGQQYQTPERAIAGGSDFIISGRGIYATTDPVETVKLYREAGWNAYLARVGGAKKVA